MKDDGPKSASTSQTHDIPSLTATLIVLVSSGAVVMLIEIMGTRVIGPVYGISLFVWAALLSVTLCALAIGYYVGGVWVDRAKSGKLLGYILSGSGLLLSTVPLLAPIVLEECAAVGPRLGPLLCALLLFAPSLTLLGMTTPVAVRLHSVDVSAAGTRVGAAYAVSTAGSLAGTLVTAFWLVPTFEVPQILLGASTFLLALGAAFMWRYHQLVAATAVLPLVLSAYDARPTLPTQFRVRAESQSLYGKVQVVDDLKRGVRFLRADHSVIGAQWLEDGSSAFAFLHLLESLPLWRPNAKTMLVIGLGTGALPTALGRRGIVSDVVEIDPAVVRFAEEYFGFSPTGTVRVEDARTFLRHATTRYDLILHDTFTGGAAPDHLLSREVVRDLHRLLNPSGLLALNFVGYQHPPHAEATLAVAATLRDVFKYVRVFRDHALTEDPEQTSNLLFFASDKPLNIELSEATPFADAACKRLIPQLLGWELTSQLSGGEVITDAHNPLTRLQLVAADAHYKAMNVLLPLELWLN